LGWPARFAALKVSAVLVAAGSGSRLGAQVPKALVEIAGIPLVVRSARALVSSTQVTALVVVTPPSQETRFLGVLRRDWAWRLPIEVVAGGAERQDSVRAGLAAAGDADLIAIHDAARPFVDAQTIESTILAAQADGAAVVGVPASDTMKQVGRDGWITITPPREQMWHVQTPQIFRADLIRAAHDRAVADRVVATDDSALVERLGVRVRIVPGTPENRKITTPDDLRWAEWFVTTRPDLH
jgi:2-C-methyl-D-erythritol 4-phosphate cytidylyltransferase